MEYDELVELAMSDVGLTRDEAEMAVDVLGSDVLSY